MQATFCEAVLVYVSHVRPAVLISEVLLHRKVLTGTERGLVGYWRINEGPGGMVFDHSSYGNVGPVKGEPQWTAAVVPVHDGT